MLSKQCVVVGYDTSYGDTITRRHRFPKDELTFNVWVERSRNNKLSSISMNDVYKRFIMCDKHFATSCKSPGFKKLITKSIPTLNLPANISPTIFFFLIDFSDCGELVPHVK